MIQLHTALVMATSVFFAILFLQSGLDKVIDWKGNYEFHTSHFVNSPLKKISGLMLRVITLIEISCGLLSVIGLIYFLIKDDSVICFYASCLASVNFLALFFGQRISKDYAGAAALVPYFILSLIGMYVTFA